MLDFVIVLWLWCSFVVLLTERISTIAHKYFIAGDKLLGWSPRFSSAAQAILTSNMWSVGSEKERQRVPSFNELFERREKSSSKKKRERLASLGFFLTFPLHFPPIESLSHQRCWRRGLQMFARVSLSSLQVLTREWTLLISRALSSRWPVRKWAKWRVHFLRRHS